MNMVENFKRSIIEGDSEKHIAREIVQSLSNIPICYFQFRCWDDNMGLEFDLVSKAIGVEISDIVIELDPSEDSNRKKLIGAIFLCLLFEWSFRIGGGSEYEEIFFWLDDTVLFVNPTLQFDL